MNRPHERLALTLAAAGITAALSCSDSPTGHDAPSAVRADQYAAQVQLRAAVVARGLSRPLFLTAPRGDPRLFIVEQPGRIRVVRNGILLPRPFLDIRGRVRAGGEQGLLSMAFHPRFATNGFFYVYFTERSGANRVERFSVSATDPNVANPSSAVLILRTPQPAANHNGGLLAFGPDGKLYIGKGDGGARRNGQNKSTLLGKLLRIDVDGRRPYAIPSDNPFVGQRGSRGEIWALGLRNPWRYAFDRQAGYLYIADVGEGRREEINVVGSRRAGLNYGWSRMEGFLCFPSGTQCSRAGLTMPVLDYGHGEGCSVTGGYVYRGRRIPELAGHYFYSDFCRGFLRSFRYVGGQASARRSWAVGPLGNVLSFGEDAAGELYVLSANGKVYKIVRGG